MSSVKRRISYHIDSSKDEIIWWARISPCIYVGSGMETGKFVGLNDDTGKYNIELEECKDVSLVGQTYAFP